MNKSFIVTGTDTDVGKTVCAAMLTLALEGVYWKPLQSGTEEGTDTDVVKSLNGHTLPEAYVFNQPLSPHRAAALDGVEIDIEKLSPPTPPASGGEPRSAGGGRPLIVEGAGGLLVPVTRELLQIDLFLRWNLPVVLCARTGLGTINHTLLSVEALQSRDIPLHGIVFIGEDNPDNIKTIGNMSGAPRVLGRIPLLEEITANALQTVFDQNFDKEDFI